MQKLGCGFATMAMFVVFAPIFQKTIPVLLSGWKCCGGRHRISMSCSFKKRFIHPQRGGVWSF
jgi:hypothetical protein